MPILIKKHARLLREEADGSRILVTRYWLRGLSRENIDVWMRDLAPSVALLNRYKDELEQSRFDPASNAPIPLRWVNDYTSEMTAQKATIEALTQRSDAGETISLLCACHKSETCHRSILKAFIEDPGGPYVIGDDYKIDLKIPPVHQITSLFF